jgi:RND family efflux transporter MFP subunit
MPATRNIALSIVFRVVVCTLAIGLALAVVAWLITSAPNAEPAEHRDTVARLLVIRAQPTAVQRQWEGFGTAQAVHASDVPSRVTATVIDRPDDIRPGRAVRTGEVLVKLDDSDFLKQQEITSQTIEDLNAQIRRLEVERGSWSERARVTEQELQIATLDYERAVKALEGDAARQREVDQKRQAMLGIERTLIGAREELDKIPLRKASLEAQLLREQASLALARQNVERSRIVAPIDGVLASVDVDDGESVTAGQRVARIVNLNRIEVPLLLPSSARPMISVGDAVALSSESGNPPLTWPAQVSRIAPDDDPATRTLRVFVEVMQDPSKPGVLAPGMFVQGVVTTGLRHGDGGSVADMRSVVPRRAIAGQRIMLIESGRIRTLPIEVDFHLHGRHPEFGVPDGQWAVLRDNLPEGALVVVDGSRALAEGSPAEAIVAQEDLARRDDGDDNASPAIGPSSSTTGAKSGVP